MAQSPGEVGHATTGEIRADIEHTRAEMGHTIDAIHARLKPRRLMSDALSTAKTATITRVAWMAGRYPIHTAALVAVLTGLACWGAWSRLAGTRQGFVHRRLA